MADTAKVVSSCDGVSTGSTRCRITTSFASPLYRGSSQAPSTVASTVITAQPISRRRRRKAIVRMSRGECLLKVTFFSADANISSSIVVLRSGIRYCKSCTLQLRFSFSPAWALESSRRSNTAVLVLRRIHIRVDSGGGQIARDLRNRVLRHHEHVSRLEERILAEIFRIQHFLDIDYFRFGPFV